MSDKKYIHSLSYTGKCLITYLVIAILGMGLSCLGLIWNNYYILTSFAIASVGAFINLFLLIKATAVVDPQLGKKNSLTFFGMAHLFRFLIMFLSIGLAALVVYLTIGEQDTKMYLSILAAGVPFFLISLVMIIVKDSSHLSEQKEEF